jgi:hypothetical protein
MAAAGVAARPALCHSCRVSRKSKKRQQNQARQQPGNHGGSDPWRRRLRAASRWPIHEVLISRGWNTTSAPVQIVVARQSSEGRVAAVHFEADLACLGVRTADAAIHDTESDYLEKVRFRFLGAHALDEADPDLAARILLVAEQYARQLGFEPVPTFDDARLLLGNANPHRAQQPVPMGGPDGRPWYVARPEDDVEAIAGVLARKLGLSGFGLVVPHDHDLERRFGAPADAATPLTGDRIIKP